MYENLTRYLPELERAKSHGDWVVDRESKGTTDDPIQMPYVHYGDTVMAVRRAIYAFVDEHPDFELTRYCSILEKNGLKWANDEMSNVDVSRLDGQAVMALLLGAVRADRFCEGALLEFFENGSVRKWLRRLQELDR